MVGGRAWLLCIDRSKVKDRRQFWEGVPGKVVFLGLFIAFCKMKEKEGEDDRT